MIFVYDIILNWCSDKIYDYFEWEKTDKIDHIKRIPLFRVGKGIINDFINNNIFIDEEFNSKIYNMTEIYLQSSVNKVPYAFMITDGISVLAVKTEKNGIVKFKSKLLLNEEEEILCISSKLKVTNILYKKRMKIKKDNFLTRKELLVKKYLLKELENAYKSNDFDKINYIYMEYAKKEEKLPEKAYKELVSDLNKEITEEHFKLYDLLQMIGSNN